MEEEVGVVECGSPTLSVTRGKPLSEKKFLVIFNFSEVFMHGAKLFRSKRFYSSSPVISLTPAVTSLSNTF